jgi:hypothetical protein
MDVLVMLNQPTYRDILLQRSESIGPVGTYFETILRQRKFSMEVLRKLLRQELYGVAGVYFENFDGTHSAAFVSDTVNEAKISSIRDKGYKPLFPTNGALYQAKNKKVSRQRGLYISPATQKELERAVDDEDYRFTKEIEEHSLPVLEYIFERSLALRKKHGEKWYPKFSDVSIARDLKQEERVVTVATENLTGILCENYQIICCRPWRKRFFLPSSKFESVKEILK